MKISVLMTVYNGEKFIEETIQSVLDQSFKDFEYIIVDDGSTDKTKKIVKSFKDKRIKYFYAGENKGYYNMHKAINFGLSKCKGKYIARIDADDICLEHRLKIQYEYLQHNKNIFLIGGSAYLIDKDGIFICEIKKKSYPSIFHKYHMAVSNSFIHSTIMFRNEGYTYLSCSEHLFFCWLTSFGKRLKNISDYLIKYRRNPNGLVAKYDGKVK